MRLIVRIIMIALAFVQSVVAVAITIEKHGAGSAYQILDRGETLEPFYYSVEPLGCDITVENLPNGLIYEVEEETGNVRISGIVDAEIGIYTFTVKAEKDGVTEARRGRLTVGKKLLYLQSDESLLSQSVLLGTDIAPMSFKAEKGTNVRIVAPDGIEMTYDDESSEGRVLGQPTAKGAYRVALYAELNRVKDTIYICVNVAENGLLKEDGGGTKQVIHEGEEMESVFFRWTADGEVRLVRASSGLAAYIDKDSKRVEVFGKPRGIGLHSLVLKFTSEWGESEYLIQIQVIAIAEPVITVADNSGKTEQEVPLRSEIDTIRVNVENADSVAVEGCPKGIEYTLDDGIGNVLVYGKLKEEGEFNITVSAFNSGMQTDFSITLASLGFRKKIGHIGDLEVINIESINVYDLKGNMVMMAKEASELRKLRKGIYILLINCEDGVYEYKLAL